MLKEDDTMNPLLRLRLKVMGIACVLGAVLAFLAFTPTGLIVLAGAVALAGVLALSLWRVRPELFADAADRLGVRRPAPVPLTVERSRDYPARETASRRSR
jgi:hypothetical protein